MNWADRKAAYTAIKKAYTDDPGNHNDREWRIRTCRKAVKYLSATKYGDCWSQLLM